MYYHTYVTTASVWPECRKDLTAEKPQASARMPLSH